MNTVTNNSMAQEVLNEIKNGTDHNYPCHSASLRFNVAIVQLKSKTV